MTTTVAQAHRHLVAEMDEAGDKPEEIASKLGISVDRVEAILDQLDESDGRPAHPDDAHRAPAVEPVQPEPRPVTESGPIVVGSPARAPRKKPAVEVRPVPDMPTGAEGLTTSDLVMTDQQRADIEQLRAELAEKPGCGDRQGTTAGYQWHVHHDDMPPCDPCAEAGRAYNRDYAAKRSPREHGTVKGARQHWGRGEQLCDPCREAHAASRKPPKSKRTSPSADLVPVLEAVLNRPATLAPVRPERAVAHLSLPLTAPALVAVIDALELAYGPDLRVTPAEGGVWVLGAAS